jgi:putative hydrolase of HD superfamily
MMSQLAAFCYELGTLSKTPRSGFDFLGSGRQSVGEHTCRALGIAFLLTRLTPEPVDELRLMQLVLVHDLPEARTGDLNYVHQKYVRVNWEKVLAEMSSQLPHGPEIVAWVREFEDGETLEARLAGDADQLEFLASLREEMDRGNPAASDWLAPVQSRLHTAAGKQLAQQILDTPSDSWWFSDKTERHWVDRSGADG